MNTSEIIEELKGLSEPEYRLKQEHFGIPTDNCLGVRVPLVRELAKPLKKRHDLVDELWASGYHEARLMVSMICDPALITSEQEERWLTGFYSWDTVDTFSLHPFAFMPGAWEKPSLWAEREPEFERRTAFATIVGLVHRHRKKVLAEQYLPFLELCETYSTDNRHYVKKAVGWALREMSKKIDDLHEPVQSLALKLKEGKEPSQRWVANDVLNEMARRASKG